MTTTTHYEEKTHFKLITPPPTMKKKNILKPMPLAPITKKKKGLKTNSRFPSNSPPPLHMKMKKNHVMTDEEKNLIVIVYFKSF